MKYNVCRYFDDVFETVIESFDDKEAAQKKADVARKYSNAPSFWHKLQEERWTF